MAGIPIDEIGLAIDHWRGRKPSPDGVTACAEVRALAEVYARMSFERHDEIDEEALAGVARLAWLAWVETLPDTPCIAICSTAQGDAVCKGCGRSAAEVQQWTAMSPAARRAVWRRITAEGSAWRFNRYAERARGTAVAHDAGGTRGASAQPGTAAARA